MSINWQDIRVFNKTQNSAFEELVCQLAREEPIANGKEFYRVAAPDGGVEAYCVLDNGEEYGWQAKYFDSMKSSQWNQIKSSFEAAFKTHPKLTKYFVCIPLDRQDPRHDGQVWFMDEWNNKTKEWIRWANSQGRNVTFEYWGSSELLHRLSEQKHAGRRLFWFSKEEFTEEWFKAHAENSVKNLGHRYTQAINFNLDIAKYFDAVSRNQQFFKQYENEVHEFLKVFRKLDDDFLRKPLVKTFLTDLLCQLELSKNVLEKIDAAKIQNQCESITDALAEYEKSLASPEKELIKDIASARSYQINKAYGAIYDFKDFIGDKVLELANCPILLLLGEAGVGKSHLLGDVVSKRINYDKACIFLLGQHFVSEEAPWTQILNNLLRIRCSEQEFLGALNARAEAQNERLLIVIDAINEGKGRYFWPNHIQGFINDIAKYPWLGLVLSIRSSYEELIIPSSVLCNTGAIRAVHRGFESVEYQACSFFFSQYGIEQPSVPLMHPEFGNPLFLKLFCEGLHRSGQKRIPKGYAGITNIIDFFLTSVDEKLSYPALFDYQPASSKKTVKKVINALIKEKLQNDNGILSYESAVDIADPIVSRYSNKKGFIDSLVSEGVLSKNVHWKNPDEEFIYFAYERFEDHLTAAYLLDECMAKNDVIERVFCDGGKFEKYIQKSYRYQGIIEALSIQIPEKLDKELYEVIPNNQQSDMPIIKAFIQSLIWRNSETIKPKVTDYINQHVLVYGESFDLFFQMAYAIAADPDHLFNAHKLHNYLSQFSMADRDGLWTIYLHNKDYEGSSMQRLIEWGLQDGAKDFISPDSALLAGIALSWLCTSTNLYFRDTATKALVCLLENRLLVAADLLANFKDVNDPYVYERVLAAIYGAVLRSDNPNGLGDLSDHILNFIFLKDEVYPNVLVRDYARNIIEYAVYKKVFNLKDLNIVRPPYKSYFPSDFPGNEEIDALKSDNLPDRARMYWGHDAIINSMVTEYGRGICRYGDFGRYTFQSALSDWDYKFDPNELSNYACRLIFDKYGYDASKHGDFDASASSGDRHKNTKERIGKKYQWIAIYEVIARLSDNHQQLDDSKSWGDENEYIWYQGPWENYLRNIDPTSIPKNDKPSHKDSKFKFSQTPYSDWGKDHSEWLISPENLPDPKEMLCFSDERGEEWIVLEIFQDWNEPVPVGYEKYDYPHKNLWYQLTSFFVRKTEADKVINWARTQRLRDRQLPKGGEQYKIFSREYYWSPAYRSFDNPYYGRTGWEEISDTWRGEKAIGKVMATTERHNWETGSDYQEMPSYLAPREFMFNKMKLKYSKVIGEWLDAENQVICLDPSVYYEDTPSCLLVRKNALQKFLVKNSLKLFWVCRGEKQIIGGVLGGHSDKYKEWLELSGVFVLNDCVDGDLRPVVISIKG